MAEVVNTQSDESEDQINQQESLMNKGPAESTQLPEIGETQVETKQNVQNILGVNMLAGNPEETTEPFKPEQPMQPEEPIQLSEQIPAESAGQGEVPEIAEQSKAA
jgi:hypothetical protein